MKVYQKRFYKYKYSSHEVAISIEFIIFIMSSGLNSYFIPCNEAYHEKKLYLVLESSLLEDKSIVVINSFAPINRIVQYSIMNLNVNIVTCQSIYISQ